MDLFPHLEEHLVPSSGPQSSTAPHQSALAVPRSAEPGLGASASRGTCGKRRSEVSVYGCSAADKIPQRAVKSRHKLEEEERKRRLEAETHRSDESRHILQIQEELLGRPAEQPAEPLQADKTT